MQIDPQPTPAPGRGAAAPLILACLTVALAVLLLYRPALGFGFINFDDDRYVYANGRVLAGPSWEGLRWAFTNASVCHWVPLTWLSLMADGALFGASAGGYHWVNALLHCLNGVLLLLLLQRATGRLWPCLLAALLFALHPLRVESVVWITERKDVLMLLFVLLGLGAHGLRARRPGLRASLAVVLCYALALMAKPSAITFPVLLLLVDGWPLRRLRLPGSLREAAALWPLLREKLPLLPVSLLGVAMQAALLQKAGPQCHLEPRTLSARLETLVLWPALYLRDTLWPTGLSLLHPYDEPFPGWQPPLALALLAGLAALALWQRERRAFLWAGLAFFLVGLSPNLGLVQMGQAGRADRFTYLSQLGLLVPLAFLADELRSGAPGRRRWVDLAAALLLASLAAVSAQQIALWRDPELLYRRALEVTPDNPAMSNTLAAHYLSQGRPAEAEPLLRASLVHQPRAAFTHAKLGAVLAAEGRGDEAERACEEALRLRPELPEAWVTLGNLRRARGQLAAAETAYRSALQSDPDDPDAHNNLGVVLAQARRYAEARGEFERALRLRPGHPGARDNLLRLSRLAAPGR